MSDELIHALEELQRLLDASQDAAIRLQQDIPGDEFPTVYKVNKIIRTLRKAINDLHVSLDPENALYNSKIFEADIVSSNDSSISI